MTDQRHERARRACVVGATGLVGSRLLARLVEHSAYTAIATVGRRAPDLTAPNLVHHLADLDAGPLSGGPADALAADTLFCCLGTTIKRAGSRARFRRVDHDMVVDTARQARASGADTLLVVSSLGADPGAAGFYLRTKGEMEQAVAGLGFERVGILRPSLLLGDRAEFRLAESVSKAATRWLNPLLIGSLARYRSIDASVVAEAMIALDGMDFGGTRVVESDEISALCD